MQTANYFVFECYSGQVRLFTSYGRQGTHQIPVPLSDPDFKTLQNDALARGISLSYYFVASGLEKKAAIRQLQNLNARSLQYAETLPDDEFSGEGPRQAVEWLPTCGSRLLQDRAGLRGGR